MMKWIIITFPIFFTTNCLCQGIDSLANRLIENLHENDYEIIIEYRFWLFNGRFNIYYEDKNLNCDGVPGVYHFFWVENDKMKCQRIDPCGYFVSIEVSNFISEKKIKKLRKDNIEFKKYSPHFNSHNMIIYYRGETLEWSLTGKQMKNQSGEVVKFMNKIQKIIRKKVNNGEFKRMD